MKFPGASWSTVLPEHTRSWLETKATPPDELAPPDSIQPSVLSKKLGCCKLCPGHNYKSKTDTTKHTSLCHRPLPATPGQDAVEVRGRGRLPKSVLEASKVHECSVCKERFGSKRQLTKHRKESSHDTRGQAAAARACAAPQASEPEASGPEADEPGGEAGESEADESGVEDGESEADESKADETKADESEAEGSGGEPQGTEPEDEARVVGMRLEAGALEQLLYWVGSGKDQCTWQPTKNLIEEGDIQNQVLELFDAQGNTKLALARRFVSKGRCCLELQGRAARRLPVADRQFEFDLVGWEQIKGNASTLGWRVVKYSEWDEPY